MEALGAIGADEASIVPELSELEKTMETQCREVYTIMGELTVVQALTRALAPGETRGILARKARA
eukprot:2105091-Lingulodinium_polyedra.AAC.1